MKILYKLLFSSIALLAGLCLEAQRSPSDTTGRSDTVRRDRAGGFNSLFADTVTLTTSDYQLALEKAFVTLDDVSDNSNLGFPGLQVRLRLRDSDTVLAVLKENILQNSDVLTLRNLQVFRTLLQNLQTQFYNDRKTLDSLESRLNRLRLTLKPVITDTVLRQIYRDSAIKAQFSPQLKNMRQLFRSSSRQLRRSLADVNSLQTYTSSGIITTTQLLERANELLNSSATRIFGKEYPFLWERGAPGQNLDNRSSLAKAYAGERKAVKYYFKDRGNNRFFLLLIGFLFFAWLYSNIRQLRKRKRLGALDNLDFVYLPKGYIVSALVMILCIAPFFDLHAPSVYIESMQFLLVIILTVIAWKKWPRELFVVWSVMAALYVCFSFTNHMASPSYWQRWLLIVLNLLSVAFGSRFLSRMKAHLHLRGFLRFVIILHNVMNVLSILCNIWGRFTLAQLFGNAAIFAFMQAIGLAVFSKICTEAILLQVVTSRAKQGLDTSFDHAKMLNSFHRLILTVIVLLWLIVFTTNLSIYYSVLNGLTEFLSQIRKIGNASFTMGGVLLFFLIIWVAHLLQRYVGYFFGATDADEEAQDKRRRSRLLIARLVLLCVGYLLAVAASGIPVDKITIVLGALGVGIGLGLQNIVSNFVSGIILIFDRPLQIGDIVEVDKYAGRVREIGLRSSTLLTSDGAEVIIPNGDILSEKIVNWTLSNNNRRISLDLIIRGSDDMEKVSAIIKDAVIASPDVMKGREPQVLFTSLHATELRLKLFFWCEDAAKMERVKSSVLMTLRERLLAQQLEMG